MPYEMIEDNRDSDSKRKLGMHTLKRFAVRLAKGRSHATVKPNAREKIIARTS